MYWYKNTGRQINICLLLLCLLSFTSSCKKPDVKELKGACKYYDLKGFMHIDLAKLAAANPAVDKTVNHNGQAETKTLKIANWGNELNLFTASDINKPSWRDSYDVVTNGDTLIYKAKTPDLKTQKLTITKTKGAVSAIHIFNHTKNMLYETSEVLSYFPDSIYNINKNQHVLLLGSNCYIITGKFRK